MIRTTITHLQEIEANAIKHPHLLPLRAGTAKEQLASGGMAFIQSKKNKKDDSITAGLTLVKNAAAFIMPAFETDNLVIKNGTQKRHYAIVKRTSSKDVIHECYFAGPGDHLQPCQKRDNKGKPCRAYWRVSEKLSALIKQGEEEHLADARRAYEMTYKLIAETINKMAGKKFGPASTPDKAAQLARKALEKQLPPALGINPGNWYKVLDRLLEETLKRDKKGFHYLKIVTTKQEGNKIIEVLGLSTWARIGKVSPREIVKY